MTPQLLIGGVDKTTLVQFGSIRLRDNINSQANTLAFTILKYGSQTYRPEIGDEVEYYLDAVKAYGGVIVEVEESNEEATGILEYSCTCKGYEQYADRLLITEVFEGETAADIVDYLVATYCTGFTSANVFGPIVIETIAFNRIPLSAALDRLARLINYVWYIDYDKDVHFMPKNTELAPFDVEEGDGVMIDRSLVLRQDLAQVRNVIYVRGGETEGEEVTEVFQLDGTDESKTIRTAFKYASQPTITVGGVSKTVLPDYLNELSDADFLWSQGQKYLRSESTWTGEAIVTGIPLVPIVVEVSDDVSIAELGRYEFAVSDPKIKSREEAILYALAQLDAYATGVSDGGFQTHETGLRSGQTIAITSAARGVTAQKYVIQTVTLTQIGGGEYVWSVSIANAKTVGIIDVLQKLLREEVTDTQAGEILLSLLSIEDTGSGADSYTIGVTEPPYYYNIGVTWSTSAAAGYTDWTSAGADTWEDIETDPTVNVGEWNRATWV